MYFMTWFFLSLKGFLKLKFIIPKVIVNNCLTINNTCFPNIGIVSGGRGALGKCGGINNPTHYVR